jgi:hypothetical protein
MSRSAFDDKEAGQLNNFRYISQNFSGFKPGEVLSFRGSFEITSVNKSRSQFSEKRLELEVLDDKGDERRVKGEGSNRFGNFVLNGKYEPKTATLEVQRTYSKPLRTLGSPSSKKSNVKRQQVITETIPMTIPQPQEGPTVVDPAYLPEAKAILRELRAKDTNKWFSSPVDAEALGLTDYFGVVKNPMDLGTVQMKIDAKRYKDFDDCIEDMRLTFVNALMYNPRGSPVYRAATDLTSFLEERTKLQVNDHSASTTIGKRNRVKKKFFEPGEDDDFVVTNLERSKPKVEGSSNSAGVKRPSEKKLKKKGKGGLKTAVARVITAEQQQPHDGDDGVESFDELDFNRGEELFMTPPPYDNSEMEESERLSVITSDQSPFYFPGRNFSVSPTNVVDCDI